MTIELFLLIDTFLIIFLLYVYVIIRAYREQQEENVEPNVAEVQE